MMVCGLLLCTVTCQSNHTPVVHFYVSPTLGSDSNPGNSSSFPFATLSKTANIITTLKNTISTTNTSFIVNLMPGTFILNSTLTIPRPTRLNDVQYSTVEWRALPGSKLGDVKIRGDVPLPISLWQVVNVNTNSWAHQMLPSNAKGNVLQCNLTLAGFKSSQIVPFRKTGFSYGNVDVGNELFIRGHAQTVARYPNKLTTQYVQQDVNSQMMVDVYMNVGMTNGTNEMSFNSTLCPNRDCWSMEKYPFAFGYWYYDWAGGVEDISSITSNGNVVFKSTKVGYGIKSNQRFFLVNFISELDQPGEYVIIDDTVYYWPLSPLQQDDDVMISVADTLISISANAQIFDSLDFSMTRGSAIVSTSNSNIVVKNCRVTCTGNYGLRLSSCSNCQILSNTISEVGQGGISISGGDRKTLTPSNSLVANNTIFDFSRIGKTYRAAVNFNGVTVTVTHNELFNADHTAILWGGNNHEISFNKIYDVCKSTADAGAIYSGRDWTMRDNVIKHNFLFRVQGPGLYGTSCIYLDDMFSSATVFGNVMFQCYRGLLLGGGRNNMVMNNIFINSTYSMAVDDRGLVWADSKEIMANLLTMPYNNSVWSAAYPELTHILDENPMAPVGNKVQWNLVTTSATKTQISQPNIRIYSIYANNTFDVPLSVFVDPSNMNFNLVSGNIYENNMNLYNFTKIPFHDIGLLKYVPPPSPPSVNSVVRPRVSNSTRSVSLTTTTLGRSCSMFILMMNIVVMIGVILFM
ncbi:hypothetical protein FDP41_002608 [Naegleria fowleri]|uniref:Right handed beta helix domain-containing protein n=1 Tax=Naegleria fowleri TaxID=5763 RepID=A0A6A5BJJ5_NAEFO|nr:uncharacterized protein FDP41_002608 [Naegleria fowleri]KAF0978093.1 hypothetical protein FDP41_002608 [Naegleria fowleri]